MLFYNNLYPLTTMQSLFSRIAHKYDKMNRIMSLGLDCFWRRSALQGIKIPNESRILDLACGTGDFTIELAKRWPNAKITGVDITPEMLSIALRKLSDVENICLLQGNAQDLSMLQTNEYSLIVCAFGFRNFPNKAKVLSECHRLLTIEGKLVVLELFRPRFRLLGLGVNLWLTTISRLFANKEHNEYQYLRQSVENTVNADEFISIAESTGFSTQKNIFMLPSASCITFSKSTFNK